MKKINTTLTIISLVLLCTLVSFVGCSDMMATLGNISLTIDLDTPEVEVASYILEGNLVDSNSRFTLNNIVPPRHTLSELKEGRWNLTVKAFDDQENQIGVGTKTIDLKAGQVVETSLLVVCSQCAPSLESFTIAGPARQDAREGSITGTTVKMEYRLASAAADDPFTPCTAGSTLLAPGTYHIRLAQAHGLEASESLTVTIPAYQKIQLTIAAPTLTTAKEYDGTNTVQGSITAGALTGVRSGDEVVVHAQASYDSASVGNSKNITVTYSLSGADALNYTKPDDTIVNTGVINQKQLSISGTTVTTNKEYDGLTSAAVTNDGTLDGKVGTEAVTVTATASYQDKSAGTGKLISVSYALGGADAGNYRAPASTSFSGEITKKALTVNPPSIRLSKEYDGTPTAVVTTPGSLVGVLSGDSVTLLESARYADKDVGNPKSITVSYTFTGSDANNYATPSDTTVTNGVITKRQLMATVGHHTKIYGQANPSFTVSITGFVNGENTSTASGYVAPTASTAATTTTDAGSYEITMTGGSATNYSFNTSDTGTLTINKAILIATVGDHSRTYGAANPAFPVSVSGFVNGEAASTASGYVAPTASTVATTSTAVGTSSITISGGSATNYSFNTGDTGTLTINKATYDMTGVTFEGATVTYSGSSNSLQIAGTLPTDVSVTYTNNEKTDAGTYTVTARFTGDGTNYNTIPDMTASLIITPLQMTGSVTLTGNWAFGETLTAVPTLTNAGPAPTYIWLRNGGLIAGATSPTYTLTEADIGRSIEVAINATAGNYKGQVVSAAANISKAAGASFSGTISAYYPNSPATKTIVNLTGFAANQTGLEASISTNGTTYGSYTDLDIDSRARAMISTTSAAKIKIRYKGTSTTFAGADLVLNVAEQDLAVGDYYAGGVVGYIYQSSDPGYVAGQLHGLIAAKTDTSTNGSKWSSNNTLRIGTGVGIGTGSANTDAIILALDGSEVGMYGAKEARLYTSGGYNDWFLPSWHELLQLRNNKLLIGNFDTNNGSTYMTSSESTQSGWDADPYYHAVYFDNNWSNYVWDKPAATQIRAVRYF